MDFERDDRLSASGNCAVASGFDPRPAHHTPDAASPPQAPSADSAPARRWAAKRALFKSYDPQEQLWAREVLRNDEDFQFRLAVSYLENPFLRLTPEESAELPRKLAPGAIGQLVAARDAAMRSTAARYAVMCMPKSGSSFLASALREALELPATSLTGFGSSGASSALGMNAREQELDEMAVTKSIHLHQAGFVAQHHTRYTQYLALQLDCYSIKPLVTVRNVLDCIVSFDDMMTRRGADSQHWIYDAQFALPAGYAAMGDEARYTVLTHSLGVWLINFYLSWKRGAQQAIVSPLIVKYEDHVLNTEALVEHLSGHVPMSPGQVERLRAYASSPDRIRSRLNVGVRGRGEQKLPEPLKQFLSDYAGLFASELTPEERAYLIR